MSSVRPLTPQGAAADSAASPWSDGTHALPHRADIEGLRGLAVIAVLSVHAFPASLTGGYAGVDIFFVLSGYLISTIVLRDLEAERFSLLDFYARRVRRILPALCTVLLATLLAGAWLTFPSDASRIGKHVAGGAAFASNLLLWLEAGYFDASSEFKPLLHLWSLGIEEQFYLLWPLALLALHRSAQWRRHGLAWLAAAWLASFALNLLCVESRPTGTFFLLPTRAWELLTGALLACASLRLGHRAQRRMPSLGGSADAAVQTLRAGPLAETAALLGLTLVGAALFGLDRHVPYPGGWALLPVAGTALLLAAGPRTRTARQFLGQRVLTGAGAISYPLYLWHWPLLVLPVLMGVETGPGLRLALLAAAVVAAVLTAVWVERPLRWGSAGPQIPLALCLALALIGLGGLVLHRAEGRLRAYPEAVRPIAQMEFGHDYAVYRASRCFLDLEQGPDHYAPECAGPTGGAAVLLWGDSHAASLYPGLASLGLDGATGQDATTGPSVAQYTKARCPPLPASPDATSRHCDASNARVLAGIAARPPAQVILAGAWSIYPEAALAGLRETVIALQAQGVADVVVIGSLPVWTRPLPRVLLLAWQREGRVPERSVDDLDRNVFDRDRLLARAIAGTRARLLRPADHLCHADACEVSRLQGGVRHPVAYDEAHLTRAGSIGLIESLAGELRRPPLP